MFLLRTISGDKYFWEKIPGLPNRFPDGTLALGRVSTDFNEIMWLYDGDDELFTLMCLRQHTKHNEVKLILPYIPHARMDRAPDDEVFTLKTFCNAINSMNFSSVVVADPHSYVSTALLDRVEVLSPAKYISIALSEMAKEEGYQSFDKFMEDKAFFFPDEGAMKRYSKLFPVLHNCGAFGVKNRDFTTGKITNFEVIGGQWIKDRPVLIVDDICSRGGTFHHASKALKKIGVGNIYLYVTHCEDTVFDGDMYQGGLVKKVYTTDSKLYCTGDPMVQTVYSFAEDFKNGKVF